MALDSNALIIPGKGTLFVNDVDATPPTSTALATITPAAPWTGSTCIGHTSLDNLPALGKDGGDANQKSSWWTTGIETQYDPTTWTLTFASLQVSDPATLNLAFGGGTLNTTDGYFEFGDPVAVNKSVLLLMIGAVRRVGFYFPNTSITLGDAPELDNENFLEIQLQAALNPSASSTASWAGKRMRIISSNLKTP